MPTNPPKRALILTLVAAATTTWLYASTLQWQATQTTKQITNNKSPITTASAPPLSAEPPRTAAQRLLAERSTNYEQIDALLKRSVTLRPLYAPYWLDRAQAAGRANNPEEATEYATKAATLWPNRPTLIWKAAMLHVQAGNTAAALNTLRQYLEASPGAVDRVLAVAARLRPEPKALLQAVLPSNLGNHKDPRDDIAWRILRNAKRQDNLELGQAAWKELSPQARQEPEFSRYYVEWMAAVGNQAEALAAWNGYRQRPEPLILENGGFEEDLAGGLGWRTWQRDGVRISRDPETTHTGSYSLRLEFTGENTHYNHLRQYLPVQPGGRYTLSFAWRGAGITTRSGPYVYIRGKDSSLASTEDQWGTWHWQRRELTFTTSENDQFVQVWVRRNRTDALDNRIEGTLWLDDFTLTGPAPETQRG